MAALTCIIAGAALETLGARSGIVTSNSMHCLRGVPVGAHVDITGRVCTGNSYIFRFSVMSVQVLHERYVASAAASLGSLAKLSSHLSPVLNCCNMQPYCLRHLLHGTTLECLFCCAAVTSSTASVTVILHDSTSHKVIAKARYTEQAPSALRARANAYLNNAATAAKSAVQRVQTAAEHALHRADGALGTQSDSDRSLDIRHKTMASLTKAGATFRAAAHRIQLAADSILPSSSAVEESAAAAERGTDSAQVRVWLQSSLACVSKY